ncbi:MAG: hypothetical protein IIA00_04340 [Proteobacteria bacterium]|nr:hypothetical protein [Pseudomonadota bacterium]
MYHVSGCWQFPSRADKGALDWLVFKAAFDRLYAALNGINVMLITYPPR